MYLHRKDPKGPDHSTHLERCNGEADEEWCPWIHDDILCWPATPPGQIHSQPCPEELNDVFYNTLDNATRLCNENGTWEEKSSYDKCHELLTDYTLFLPEYYVFYGGQTLSLIALSIAAILFLSLKELRCLRNTIHVNLMATYIMADLLWIVSSWVLIDLHVTDSVAAIIITLLHYSILSTFFWMFVEGLFLYILVVETFSRGNLKLWGYILIGWGIPFLSTSIWSIGLINYYEESPISNSTENDEMLVNVVRIQGLPKVREGNNLLQHWGQGTAIWDMCFMKIPALAVLIVNLFFLVRIMTVVWTKLKGGSSAEIHQHWKAARAFLVLMPLLGINYLLLIYGEKINHIHDKPRSLLKVTYESFRSLLFSTQGFTVAIIYCFLNTEVRNTVRHRFNTWVQFRDVAKRYHLKKDNPEQMRLFNESGRTGVPLGIRKKRDSSVSDATTMTTVNQTSLTNGQIPSRPGLTDLLRAQ